MASKDLSLLKVAIVHDWLVGGGAELVVLELHKMFPNAPIYTSYCTDDWRSKLDGKVVTGWLQHFGKLRKFLPLARQHWFRNLDMSGYDLVISSSGNGEAKFVRVQKPAVHICYCHTPTHFYWRHYEYYKNNPGFGQAALVSLALRLLAKPLRKQDYKAAQKVDYFIANSTHIQSDVKKFYGQESTVIYPPVDVPRFSKIKADGRAGFITVGRQVSYKRLDLLVDACTNLGLPLKVIGRGPENGKLRKQAGPTVEFITDASDQDVENYMSGSEAFILAAFEDFGITPVEAIAAGTPVIAYKAGGALDYVKPGVSGEFFEPQTTEALEQVLKNFKPDMYDHKKVSDVANKFSTEKFVSNMNKFIEKHT